MNDSLNQNPRVLIIDDDQTVHLWAARHLPGAGFALISSYDGVQGLAEYKTQKPDIVLVDIEMPLMDGFETCREIRALPNGDDVPLVMMTVTEDEERIAQAYASGATDFTIKPINWGVLCQRLHYMVKANDNLQKLEQSELRLSKAKELAKLGDWEWQVDTNNLFWSDEVYSLVEADLETFIPDINNFWNFIRLTDLPYVKHNIRKAIKNKTTNNIEFGIITTTGKERFVLQHIQAVTGNRRQLKNLIGTIQDITERKAQENKILQLAFYDEVTQLPNRLFFLKNLASTIALSRRHGWTFALLFLDLDGFKGVNDTYGHLTGDQLLQEISGRLKDGLRCSDLATRLDMEVQEKSVGVARLGGDEFIILLNALAYPENAATVAERIHRWINEPVKLKEHLVHIGVSIGIAIYPQDGEDSETLLKNADIAMYHAKKLGKGNYQFFHEGMALRAKKRLEMETYMFLAASKNELLLYYQPVNDVESGKLIGAEALLRWNSPILGFLLPIDFISLAEENGMINQFGEWALRSACRQHRSWSEKGLGNLAISVNLSSLQINQSMFITMVANVIQEYEVNPKYITFEITESMIMADTENMLTKLRELKNLGIKLSVDDFGTGYSSLRYLNRFPLDALKIDRSFVKDLPKSTDASAIVNAILALAKALKLITIAEGVETSQQLAFLRNTTCNAVQGYYFAKPLSVADFQQYW
ncbi:MAG: EAL domain-containing protein [Gammaproteobacteria bacterium]|nr:EAL domain-containing protein [Gammaproteobacteria bacterium]